MPLSGAARPALQLVENGDRLAARRIERADRAADRLDGFEQAPERAEQAEEHEQPDEIAAGVARFVETRADAVHDRAHRGGRERQHARPVAQHGRHRRQQHRLVRAGEAGIGNAERVDQADFGIEAHHLAEGVEDAEEPRRAEDEAVETRIVHQRDDELLVQDGGQERDQRQEHEHAHQEHAGRSERCAPAGPLRRPICRLRAISCLRPGGQDQDGADHSRTPLAPKTGNDRLLRARNCGTVRGRGSSSDGPGPSPSPSSGCQRSLLISLLERGCQDLPGPEHRRRWPAGSRSWSRNRRSRRRSARRGTAASRPVQLDHGIGELDLAARAALLALRAGRRSRAPGCSGR